MKAFRLTRIASRPFQSATPSLQTASSVKQSKPFPKVLSSISFHMSSSHLGGSVFVNTTCISFSFAVGHAGCADAPWLWLDQDNSRGANWLNYIGGNKSGLSCAVIAGRCETSNPESIE